MAFDDMDTAARHARAEAAKARRRDLHDLGNEQAGRETGRARRFLGPDAEDGSLDRRGKRAERRFRDLLELLLVTDPSYARLYRQADERLREAENKADAALAALAKALEAARRDEKELIDRAPKLSDGRAVFRRADGAVVDAEGRVIAGLSAADIVWPPSAPRYEALREAGMRAAELEAAIDDLGAFRTDVLGRWRDRLEDGDDPPSAEMLKEIIAGTEAWPEPAARAFEQASLSSAAALPEADPSSQVRLDVPEL